MDRRRSREVQLVRDIAHLGKHRVRPEVAEGEFLVRPWSKGSLNVWLKLEVDLITHLEDVFRVALVSLLLHTPLSSEEVLAHKVKHCSTVSEHCFNIRNRGGFRRGETKMSRRMPIQYLEGGPVERRMHTGVVPILGKVEPSGPLAGALVDEATEERLEALVDVLRLSVRLRVVRRAHAEFGLCQAEQLLLEEAREDAIAVGDDVRGHPMDL